jgi:hypothetical protein
MTGNDSPRDRPSGALETARAVFGSLDLIIGVLLTAMLLPLVLGPIVVAYEFAQADQYVEAGAIALLAATWYVVGGWTSGHARRVRTSHRLQCPRSGGHHLVRRHSLSPLVGGTAHTGGPRDGAVQQRDEVYKAARR